MNRKWSMLYGLEGNKTSEKIVQIAGRERLGKFAPMFVHLNDDVLFGKCD